MPHKTFEEVLKSVPPDPMKQSPLEKKKKLPFKLGKGSRSGHGSKRR
jgi:hypothetical protein